MARRCGEDPERLLELGLEDRQRGLLSAVGTERRARIVEPDLDSDQPGALPSRERCLTRQVRDGHGRYGVVGLVARDRGILREDALVEAVDGWVDAGGPRVCRTVQAKRIRQAKRRRVAE